MIDIIKNLTKNFAIQKIRKTCSIGFVFILIFQLVFGAGLFLLFSQPVFAAAPTYNQTAGTYTDDFSTTTGVPTASRNYVWANTSTGKVQLTHDDDQTAFTTPYKTSGSAYIKGIQPTSVAKWGSITFDVVIPPGTTLTVQIYGQGSSLTPDTYLAGNSTGFSTSPIDISGLPVMNTYDSGGGKISRLDIKISMTTADDNTLVTPTLDNMVVSWTTTQGDLSATTLAASPFPIYTIDQQGTNKSSYANSVVYPAFKWASAKKTGVYLTQNMLMYNDDIISSTYTAPLFGNSKLYSLDRDTGAENWSVPYLSNGDAGTIGQNGTFYRYEILSDFVAALDLADGSVKWTRAFGGGHGNSHIIIGSDGTIYTIYYASTGKTASLYAFNADGSIKSGWPKTITLSEVDEVLTASPISVGSDGTFYFTTWGKLMALNPADGSVKWEYLIADVHPILAPVIAPDGTIYLISQSYYESAGDANIYAITPGETGATLKWQKKFATVYWGFDKLILRADGNLWAYLRSATGESRFENYNETIAEISSVDGSTLWSKQGDNDSYGFTPRFSDSASGLYTSETDTNVSSAFAEKLSYYDSNGNLKWQIPYTYNYTGDDYYSFYRPIIDDRGWVYASLTDDSSEQYVQYFALAPWTLSDNSNNSGIKIAGDTLSFSVTTSMLQTNPLLSGDNQVQIVMSNNDKVPLSYSSTDSSGNTIWTGSYTLPKSSLACGTHSYTIEASQSYLQTDITTHFASAPTESNNTGITATGSFTSTACGGGVPVEAYNPPTLPVIGNFQILINNNNQTTNNREVTLNLISGSDTAKMSLSNTPDFKNASQEDYQATKRWDLCSLSGNAIKDNSCPAGAKTVYAKFFTKYGVASNIVSDTINYQPTSGNTPNTNQPSTIITPLSPIAPITRISPIVSSAPFLKDLKLGQTHSDVKRLQIFLNSDPATQIAKTGPGSPGHETSFFGSLTKLAVIKFQEKYASEILTPLGLKKGTGMFSKNTRGKVNGMMGR